MHRTPFFFRSSVFTLLSAFLAFFAIQAGAALPDQQIATRDLPPNELPEQSRGYQTYYISGNTALLTDLNQPAQQHEEAFEEGTIYVRNPLTHVWERQAGLQVTGRPKALQGDTAVFTSYGQDDHSPEPIPNIDGTLTIFKRTGTTWTEQQVLTFNPNFGIDVAIDGNSIAVFDPGQYEGYDNEIIFVEYNGTSWIPAATFYVGSTPDQGALAMGNNFALANVSHEGNFRTYQRVNGVWTEQAEINDHHNFAFDVDGNTAIVENRVYVFNGTEWTLQTTLIPNESVDGLLVGAIEDDTIVLAGENKSFVFTRSGTAWTQQQKLLHNGTDVGHEGVYSDSNGQYQPYVIVQLEGGVALIHRYTFDLNADPTDPTATPVATDEPTSEPTAEVTETATPPATDEPTPVVTDEPTDEPTTEPTSGPTATSTPQTDSALNANTGFETGSLEPWKVKDNSGDKLKCSIEKSIAYTGVCAFRFNNGKGSSGKLVQKIDFSTRINPISGNALELSLYAKTKGGAEGTAKVVVKYADGSRQKFGVDLTDTAKTYIAFSKSEVLTQTAIAKVKLVIRGTNAQGRLFVDDVALRYIASAFRLDVLPLP